MISFFNPLLLFGILGAGIPVVIHLINRKKAVSHKFAAIDFLLRSDKRIQIKFKFRQWILLILRTCLFAFLSIALAKPFVTNLGGMTAGKNVPASNVIILDDSCSMHYVQQNKTFFQSAKITAKKIVENLTKEDDVAIITSADIASQILPELSHDKENILNSLERLQPGYGIMQITSALDMAIEILHTTEAPKKKIFLLTDLTENGWDFTWFESEHQKLKKYVSGVHIVDLSEGETLENVAVTQVTPVLNVSEKGGESRIIVTIDNFSPSGKKNLLTRVFVDQKMVSQGFFDIDAYESKTKEFSFYIEKGKDHIGRVETFGDNLAIDNTRYFFLNKVQQLEALLIDGDPKTNIYESETFYLEKALNPEREHASCIETAICSVHEVHNIRFDDFDIVFLCNVETLPQEKIKELETFAQNGGAVIFSLGNRVEAEYYNNAFRTLLPQQLYTTRTFSSDNSLSDERPLFLKTGVTAHPVMRDFSETYVGFLSSVNIYRLFYINPTPVENTQTILLYSDDTPALIERQVGLGKTVLLTTTIDRSWTDFPVKPFFVPLMQQLCRYVSGTVPGEIQNEIVVKQEWQYPCPYGISGIEIIDPKGTKRSLQPQFVQNESAFLYDETHIPGIYAITVEGKSHAQFPMCFSVNLDASESKLKKIDPKKITALMGDINFTLTASHRDEERTVLMGDAKKTLWGLFLFFILCMLVAESYISRK
ncbi:MAG: VWA domain-containing protein [Candidatus Brocadiaceae bacterium]|nr:VWA domain-containing protein [Candidatus Brocadiaceae bacterium]